MKAAVAYLEPHMEKADAGGKGRVVLGTVKGDVHDIGKNLVDIILTNNGYEVHNIGIKAPLTAFVEKATEVQADAIGMSGLLVKSTLIMRENLEELNTQGLAEIPVLLGGAAPDPHVRGTRSARGLRRPAVLRQGRLRGSPHDGPAHGGQEDGRARPRLRTRPRRSDPAAPQVGDGSRTRGHRRGGAFRRRGRRRDLHTSVPRITDRQGHGARRDRRLHQRDRAVPQPVAVPARQVAGRERRRVQGTHPPDPARAARRGQGRGLAGARGDLGVLPGQRRRQRPHRLDRRRPPERTAPVLVPASTQRPPPVHRRLLPQRGIRRRRLRRLPRRHRRANAPPNASASCSPPTSTRSTCSPTACRSR